MSPTRYRLLSLLEQNPGRAVPELAPALGCSQARARKSLDKARLARLVTRHDARYWLTNKGLQKLHYVREHGLIEEVQP